MDILSLLPQHYGLVSASLALSALAVQMIGGSVMGARSAHGVDYPNMYATVIQVDGKSYTNAKSVESAEAFNNAQRGHQNILESHYAVMVLAAVGGLAAPQVAAAGLMSYTVGVWEYARHYRTEGAKHRNDKLALLKYAGLLALLGCNGYLSYLLYTK